MDEYDWSIDKWTGVLIRSSAKELVGGHVSVSENIAVLLVVRSTE